MKIKNNFSIRNIAGSWVALPLGNSVVDITGMLTLNDSGVMLWRLLEGGCTREDLVNALLNEYDVTREEALADVNSFVDKLVSIGCLEL